MNRAYRKRVLLAGCKVIAHCGCVEQYVDGVKVIVVVYSGSRSLWLCGAGQGHCGCVGQVKVIVVV